MSFPMPDPPMALFADWEDWKESALNWIEQQEGLGLLMICVPRWSLVALIGLAR